MALDEHELGQRISAIEGQLKLLADALDRPTLAARVEQLEGQMGAAGFWDDQEKAAKVNAEYARDLPRLRRERVRPLGRRARGAQTGRASGGERVGEVV